MKIETTNGVLTARAETKEDIQVLLNLETKGTPTVKARKYRKQMPKTCHVCGQKFRGNVGLGIHLRRAHGIKSGENVTNETNPVGAGSFATA